MKGYVRTDLGDCSVILATPVLYDYMSKGKGCLKKKVVFGTHYFFESLFSSRKPRL